MKRLDAAWLAKEHADEEWRYIGGNKQTSDEYNDKRTSAYYRDLMKDKSYLPENHPARLGKFEK